MGLPLKFAHALQSFLAEEASLYAEGADPAEARQLPLRLLEEYERCCGDELKRLRAELQRSDQASAAALAAECELLRGERNSWSLLRWLYCDWEGRQLTPPPFPEPPEDWGRALRELGPEAPPLLDAATGQPDAASIAQARAEAEEGLSKAAADAGVAVRTLHDEAVQEAAILAADPVLDLGAKVLRWLEGIAYAEKILHGDVTVQERNPLARTLATLGAGRTRTAEDGEGHSVELLRVMAGLGVPEPDASFCQGSRRLDPVDAEQQALFLRDLWKFVRAGRLEDAKAFCRSSQRWWRAATISGGEPWRWDAAAGRWLGNPERAPWRAACAAIAQRAMLAAEQERPGAAYEAAIYACLSGRAAMQPALATKAVCAGWEDTLWAHAKLSVAEQLATLQAQINAAAPDAVPPRATPAALLPRLLDYASTSAATHGEAAEASRHHELQRALVLLRLVQLPGLRSADGVSAALQRFFAAAPGWVALFPDQAAPWPADAAAAAAAAAIATADFEAPSGTGAPEAARVLSRRSEAHLLRFATHASLFLYTLPLSPAAAATAAAADGADAAAATAAAAAAAATPPCEEQWQRLLRTYVEHLCEAAARAPRAPSSPAAPPPLALARTAAYGAGPAGGEPTPAQAAGMVALLCASVRPDSAVVHAVASFFGKLPADLPPQVYQDCLAEVAQQLPARLLPRIALHALVAKQAAPLPTASRHDGALVAHEAATLASGSGSGSGSALAADAAGRLRAVLWLEDDGGHYLHQALGYTVCLLRRVVAAAGYTTEALLPPSRAKALLASQPVSEGVFVAVGQREDGAALLCLEGEDVSGAGQFFRALPLQHGAVARLELPYRGRCALLEEGDALVFFLEEATPLEPPATAWYSSLCAAAAAAEEAGRVTHGPALAPNLEVLAELHERYVAMTEGVNSGHGTSGGAAAGGGGAGGGGARAGAADLAAADGPRATALQSMQRLHSELYWWWVLVKSEDDLAGWRRHLGSRPLPQAAPYGSATLREASTEGQRALWCRGLVQRASAVRESITAALTVREEMMGELPTSAQLCYLWGAEADADADADAVPPAEAELPAWPAHAPQAASGCAQAASGGGAPRVALRSAAGLSALRAQIVPRLLRTLHEVLLETARQTGDAELLRASLYLSEIVADERYQLYAYLDKEGLRELLKLFRLSALEMLGAGHAG